MLNLKNRPVFDVVVVGAGMAGCVVAHEAIRKNLNVLLCDKGFVPYKNRNVLGHYPEEKHKLSRVFSNLKAYNREYEQIQLSGAGVFTPFIGSGFGGSTLLYGMLLERFLEQDLASWPIHFLDLKKHYEVIENKFGLNGTQQVQMSKPSCEIFEHLKSKNLNPYKLNLANKGLSNCFECQNYLCPQDCKKDAFSVFIKPYLDHKNLTLLEDFSALSIKEEAHNVYAVCGQQASDPIDIFAKKIIIAAGALRSPQILLHSMGTVKKLEHHVNIGKYLSRHLIDLFFVKLQKEKIKKTDNLKHIGLDLFSPDGQHLSFLHSFGRMPCAATIFTEFYESHKIFQFFSPMIANSFFEKRLDSYLSQFYALAALMQDTPDPENKVYIKNGILKLAYRVHKNDVLKVAENKHQIENLFKTYGLKYEKQFDSNRRLAHVSGTCRMGLNISDSVVDQNFQVHGVDGVFVVDSSVFPTSGSRNPSLTIAAMASLAAEKIFK